MLAIRLEPDIENRLNLLAKRTGRTKTFYVRTALEQFIEDREDYLLAVDVMERDEPTISLDELERNLGLAH